MPTYTYVARDERGKAVSGAMSAATPEALADELRRMGYLVTRTREVREGWSPALLLERLRGVGYDELVLFNVQLSKMIQVGIPLMSALKTLEEQTTHVVLRRTIHEVAGQIESGQTLSTALAQHPRVFSHLFISMIRAGELSGRLDEILARLADFSQRQAELREQVKTALLYPLLLLIVGVGVMTFLVISIIPKFMKIFLEAGVALPLPTRLLYQLSQLLVHWWFALIAAAIVAAVAGRAYLRTPRGRRQFDAWLLRLPVVGTLARQIALARFARTFETLASSGVPILEALDIIQQTVGNVIISEVVRATQEHVRRGGSIVESLRQSREFPPIAVQMISVGETSGTLDHMLGQIADHYDQMVRHGLKRSTALLEPVFLGVMGGMVAFIMASILMPMFRLVNVIHH